MINIQILYLSIVQSLTEFLPVSSSGHLILFPKLFGFSDLGASIDVAVHLGSIFAVIIYFSADITKILVDLYKTKLLPKFSVFGNKVFYMLIVATIPVVIVGLVLHHFGLDMLRSQKLVGWTLLGFGILLGIADKFSVTLRKIEHLGFVDAFIIGCAQCLALIPGTSRSGVTMTFARFLGMERTEAAKFSMLMSIPAITGAAVLVFFSDTSLLLENASNILDGIIYSFLSSLVAIFIIMNWLKKSTFMPFVLYRIVFGCYLLLDSYGVF